MNRHIETIVRVLFALPITSAYFYIRHFDERYAYLVLTAGLMLLMTAMHNELTQVEAVSPRRRP